jgi:hypothetical protein
MRSWRVRGFAVGLFACETTVVGLLCACGVSSSVGETAPRFGDAGTADALMGDTGFVDAGFVDAGCNDGALPSGLGEPFLCAEAGAATLSCWSGSEYCLDHDLCMPLSCACGANPSCACLPLPTMPHTCEVGGGIFIGRVAVP